MLVRRNRSAIRVLLRAKPRAVWAGLGLLTLSGLAEGIGILSLLPLIARASGRDQVSTGVLGLLDQIGIARSVGGLIIVAVVGLSLKNLLFFLGMRNIGYAAADVAAGLRNDLICSVSRARWVHLTGKRAGNLAAATGTEANRVYEMFLATSLLATSIVQLCVYFALAALVSMLVTGAAIAFGAFLVLGLRIVTKMARESGERETTASQALLSVLEDGLSAIKPIKVMAREQALLARLKADIEDLRLTQRKQALIRAIQLSVHEPLLAGFLAIGLYVSLRSGFPIERLLFLAFVFHRLATRLGNVQGLHQLVAMYENAYWSMEGEIATTLAAAEPSRPVATLAVTKLERRIEFRSVSFSYTDTPVFKELDLDIEAKSFVCLSGPSGSGKTTIADLMVGLLIPSEGEICVDGVPLARIDMHTWRSHIGYVPQDAALLHDNILENVRLGRDLPDSAVFRALDLSQSWSFIDRLPDGVRSVVGEHGSRLSGGERQRIAVARAIVHLPTLLILDEATDPLDSKTEAATLEALRSLGSTMVGISHKAQVLAACDKIIDVTSADGVSKNRLARKSQ